MSFWMLSLIMEDDKPVKPTDISLLCTVVEMICANYFPDMVCAPFCHNLRIFYYAANIYFIDLQYSMLYICCNIDIGSRIIC